MGRYALTGKEVVSILMQRHVKVDGKVRTDATYPAGFMDVIDIPKTDEHFRLVYDTKGRFVAHRITKVRPSERAVCRPLSHIMQLLRLNSGDVCSTKLAVCGRFNSGLQCWQRCKPRAVLYVQPLQLVRAAHPTLRVPLRCPRRRRPATSC